MIRTHQLNGKAYGRPQIQNPPLFLVDPIQAAPQEVQSQVIVLSLDTMSPECWHSLAALYPGVNVTLASIRRIFDVCYRAIKHTRPKDISARYERDVSWERSFTDVLDFESDVLFVMDVYSFKCGS